MAKPWNEMPEEVMEHLRGPHVVIVSTLSNDGEINMELLSWVLPMDSKTVRMVINPNFPGGVNLRENGKSSLQLIGENMTVEMRGQSHVVKEQCESVKFAETIIDFVVEEGRVNMFPANYLTGSIPVAPNAGTEGLHEELDELIYAEMKATPMLNA
ncbi:MAG: hypothetical protein FVQ83_16025 [Chloroflexi bacterium]|nr:hypothetical protein [Chloroflexota bacterium]